MKIKPVFKFLEKSRNKGVNVSFITQVETEGKAEADGLSVLT